MTAKELIQELDIDVLGRIDQYVNEGKKVIGVSGPFAPEELVYASGMIPVGIWGQEGEVVGAKEYFPAFYASIILRTLDLGLEKKLDKLSGMVITNLSDGLKGFSQNWKRAVDVPLLYIPYGQNRKIEAGLDYNEKQYIKLKEQLEEISGNKIEDDKIEEAIALYNEHRKAMREFNDLAAKHLNTVTPILRNRVFSSAYVYDVKEHLEKVKAINEALAAMPEEEFKGKKVVTTGILANSEDILKIFEEYGFGIVDDNICHESLQYETPIDEKTGNPVRALAKEFSDIEGNLFIFDEKKLRGPILAEKVKEKGADGVVYLLTKFSDTDEFDYPIIRKDLEKENIPLIKIEVDQQMVSFEQAKTALQTFADMI
ncbi:benzoyl-CoA reductase/2-hydroxyglutaryl-CoA dehydratase subunit BcrC/BadD/HgdB [Peptoniphilus ivorii]|uniref:2-hydroxyacyl-CoA dehydratase subunit D n=1 Tax=Aedoeadaptatus ivorii TaxID=54006 RepID=UPI002788F967|nr:2-hydroxyacyl-CoA dehydratase family protein [Peptoniphilus ivorii]MDQ0508497.1 benzoyl-CoA reductase/2-hydroxyglutaryl-CoA dehydratase subunit BcrC/BadD/HgdB [Peptoniphilus ivorii]